MIGYIAAVAFEQYGERAFKLFSGLFVTAAVVMNGVRITVKYILSISSSGRFARFFDLFEDYAHLALGVALFLVMYRLFRARGYSALLRLSDKYSYSVYIVHQLFILSPFGLMSLTAYPVLNWLAVLGAILAVALALRTLTDRVMSILNTAD